MTYILFFFCVQHLSATFTKKHMICYDVKDKNKIKDKKFCFKLKNENGYTIKVCYLYFK